MTSNAYKEFLEEDDDILASVLEESLRLYNELEVPMRTDIEQEQNNIAKTVSSPTDVVDLCDSPEKEREKGPAVVQSRLSYFFKKPTSVSTAICEKKIGSEINIEQESNQNSSDVSSSPACNDACSLTGIFYKEPDAEGFHLSSGSHYVYPSNLPVREYQMDIVRTALFHNTLVSLPTGTGKTFIAAVIMYNFYRWYPMGKIIFMAPTRPLVAQQIEACHSIMGIPKEVTFEMTGNIPPDQRYLAWKKYRVFFLTPQVLANDLSNNKCPSEMFRCIIVDEAHRATKDYSYAQVLRHLHEENRIFRIVGLSATPGTTVDSVTEVIQNLNISKLEFRTDESPDVAKYMNKKDVECITVKLSSAMLHVRSQFLIVYDKYSRRLKQYHALTGNVTNMAKFQILGAKQKFMSTNLAREMPKQLVGCLINDFTVCMSLAYALELLNIYGIKVFYMQSLDLLENHKCLSNDADYQKILHGINRELNSQDLTWSHPKLVELKKIVLDYFNDDNSESNSKIIIFCQYRVVVVEIFALLQTFGSRVKPVMFVGQSLKEKGGLPQKKQLEVMSRFKSGDFNVLIATSVAEEGLDIGEVDLIICLEANKSPIKFVQRLGRTGRKRSGKCITLLTEGKEQMKYKSSVSTSKTLVTKMAKNKTILSKLAPGGPRLIPKSINPQRLMIHVKISKEMVPETKKKAKRKTNENIMQYTTSSNFQNETIEEVGPDIFQNNEAEKAPRRPKKRKIAEAAGRAVSPAGQDATSSEHCDPIASDASGNDCIILDAVETNDETNGFADELSAFNSWMESCERVDTVVMDEHFFKLLNFFTDPCPTTEGVDVVAIERPGTAADLDAGSLKSLQNVNGDRRLEPLQRGSPTISSRNEIEADDLFGDRSAGCSHLQQPRFGDVQPADDQRKSDFGCSTEPRSPVICSIEDDEGLEVVTEVDLNDRIEENLVDHHRDETISRIDDADKDSSDSVKSMKLNDCGAEQEADSGTDCEDDAELANLDFEDMFKSQRADKFIERYNSEITSGGCARSDEDDVGEEDNSESVSPEFFSCKMPRKKCDQTKPVTEPETVIDLLTPEERDGATAEYCSSQRLLSDDEDADLMFLNCSDGNEVFTQKPRTDCADEVFTQKPRTDCADEVFTQKPRIDCADEVFTQKPRIDCADEVPAQKPRITAESRVVEETCGGAAAVEKEAVLPWPSSSLSYGGRGLRTFDTLKACNLLKPGFSLKMTGARTASERPRSDAQDDVSPVRRPPPRAVLPPALKFSQSTPKAPSSSVARTSRPPKIASTSCKTVGMRPASLLTSSSDEEEDNGNDSDSDVFVSATKKNASGPRRATKKRRIKRKKKFVFIDDEADVSNYCGDTSGATTAAVQSDSDSEDDENDMDGELDSSFIDDDHDRSEPSTSMTEQYLQSVKNQTNVRGVFKIPHLSTQHYNIDVYSQTVDKNDNSYEEDSFCVRDVSDANTSSSAQHTSEERPTKPKKRKRIRSPQPSSDSDSTDRFLQRRSKDKMPRKRTNARASLDFSG